MKIFTLLLVVSLLAFTRVASAQSVAGDWDATINTPGGVRAMKIVFKQESEKLTGTVKREAGDVPLEGTIKGTAVEFSYTVNYNGNALGLTVNAKLDGNAMKGIVSFGGQAEEEFAAKRAAGAISSSESSGVLGPLTGRGS